MAEAHTETRSIPFSIPTPPKFTTVEEERLHRKQRLAAAFRLFGKFGYDEGVAGHITCRDPELLDHFWVNPFGMHYSQIKVSDLILVNHKGEVVYGNKPVNAAAFAIHSAIHKARPDVIAAAHSHSMYGKTWSTLGRGIEPITQDACRFFERCAVLHHYGGVVDDTEEGDKLAECLGKENHAIILQNHGILTVGQSVDECIFWYVSLERTCESAIKSEMSGRKPIVMDLDVARKTRDLVATPLRGWFGFQPMYDLIVKQQPDLLL